MYICLDETDSGFDLGHSRSPTEVDDNAKSFGEHVKSNSNTSLETGNKSYTPLFKKKRQTPPSRRSTDKSKRRDHIMEGAHNESSDEELASQISQVSLNNKQSKTTYNTNNL